MPQAMEFNPKRENLDKVLNWNGPEHLVGWNAEGFGKAPRGCPGHDLSQKMIEKVVNIFLKTAEEQKTEL
jgi:hypothetical protein